MPNDDGTAGVMSGHVAGKVAGAGQGQGAAEARLLAAEGATSAGVMMSAVPEQADHRPFGVQDTRPESEPDDEGDDSSEQAS